MLLKCLISTTEIWCTKVQRANPIAIFKILKIMGRKEYKIYKMLCIQSGVSEAETKVILVQSCW